MGIGAHHDVWRLASGDYGWPTLDIAIYRKDGLDASLYTAAAEASAIVQSGERRLDGNILRKGVNG